MSTQTTTCERLIGRLTITRTDDIHDGDEGKYEAQREQLLVDATQLCNGANGSFSELDQLRELAKAAVEYDAAYQAFVDAHDGPDSKYNAAFIRQSDARLSLDKLTRAYAASQPKASQ